MDEFANKDALLQAVATAGSQGAADYKAAQAALAAQQHTAIQGALATSVPLNAEQQGAASGIIGGGYAPQQTRLGGNATADQAYYGQLGAASGKFFDTLKNSVLPAHLAANAAAAASRGGGGGGGGRGGGGGGSDDWAKNLKDAFGTASYQQAGLLAEAANYGDPKIPLTIRAQQLAMDKYGVPDYAAQQLVPNSKYLTDLQAGFAKDPNTSLGFAKTAAQRLLNSKTASRTNPQPIYPWSAQSSIERRYAVQTQRGVIPSVSQYGKTLNARQRARYQKNLQAERNAARKGL